MKRFILYILSFLIPVVVLLMVFEYTLRSIPNTYYYKDKIFPTQYASTVKILSFGSSHGFWGINPSLFSKPAYNLGFPSQSLKFDDYLLNRYIDRCDSLQYVILPISYNSFRDDLETGPEWIRTKGYCIYMGCDYHQGELKFNYELFGKFNTKMLSTIWQAWLGMANNISCDSLGWGKGYLLSNRPINWENYGNLASGHTIKHRKYVEQNISYIESMLRMCESRGIRVLMITTPTYKTYYENLDYEQWNEMQDICNNILQKYSGVRYYNWINDSRFLELDFWDGDHLNEYGAKKMTCILDQIIDNWENE